ncbi:RNA-directed DNA polymerase from transposon x-element [Paraphaeosphaeria minitans]|uniref:RNA-directed DNA polymerase from transposon x-element n=1 Tax=Paraphaeosphaeria minitans TaxID=565426 RepID=A0A9P6KKU9_9PLEO|nr:RNA-directed DNA polymerase from transposon x-element [Paraphaeosphaeria minitans]
MLEHPNNTPAYNGQQQPSLPSKQLRVCWANVGRSSPCHITILEVAFQKGLDVVCVQEPFTCANSRTSTHPGFRHLAPISTWDTPTASGSARPRVMTYIRKGYHLRLQTRESLNHPDLLWVVVNGVAILNCYRQPLTPDVLQYVTHLTPPQHCLVGGDFNVRHESFEPAVTAANGGIELARWAAAASMDYIGVPGQPTHCAGHVLDLTFSNIPFAQSAVEASMHSGSDHETIVTSIPTAALGTPHLAQYHYRVPEASLPKFAGLIEIGVQGIPDPLAAQDTAQLDNCVSLLTETIQHSVRTAGRPDRKEGRAAPWWTEECKTAYQAYKRARQLYLGSPPSEETRAFKTIVRQAKRQYWRHVIDNAKDDKDLFKRSSYAPLCVVDEHLTIHPILPGGEHCQPALRWLGIWFDRRLTFRRHVAMRAAKAAKVAHHIRSLARTTCGPPASSLRKATIACVYPSLLHGTECWYRGRTKPPRTLKPGRPPEVSAYVGWHIAAIDKTIAIAARGILPVWRTTPTATLFRDAGLPSAAVALEEAKLRYATHLRAIDSDHLLTNRAVVPIVNRGKGAGKPQRIQTKVQQLGSLLPEIPRTELIAPHYSPGCRTDPTLGIDKKTAAKSFKEWWAQLPPLDVTIFSDGSEQYTKEGEKRVTYGYAADAQRLPGASARKTSWNQFTSSYWWKGEPDGAALLILDATTFRARALLVRAYLVKHSNGSVDRGRQACAREHNVVRSSTKHGSVFLPLQPIIWNRSKTRRSASSRGRRNVDRWEAATSPQRTYASTLHLVMSPDVNVTAILASIFAASTNCLRSYAYSRIASRAESPPRGPFQTIAALDCEHGEAESVVEFTSPHRSSTSSVGTEMAWYMPLYRRWHDSKT